MLWLFTGELALSPRRTAREALAAVPGLRAEGVFAATAELQEQAVAKTPFASPPRPLPAPRPAGIFGGHRFYLGQWRTGLLWMFTGGLFLVGWIMDAWRIPDMVNEHNREAWDLHFQTLMDGGDFELDDTFEALDGGPGYGNGGGAGVWGGGGGGAGAYDFPKGAAQPAF